MKRTIRSLALRTQTLCPLTHDVLRRVGGGFIMKDSVIVRTSGRIDEGDTATCPEPRDGGPIPT